MKDNRITTERIGLRIRQATLRDGPAVVAVLRASAPGSFSGRDSGHSPLYPSNYDAQRYAADRQIGRTFYLAEFAGQIVGVVAVRVLDYRTGEIARLAVKDEYQKRGFGSALMIFALTWGREQDVARMELAVPASHSELRLWYEGFGFTTTVTREPSEPSEPSEFSEPPEPWKAEITDEPEVPGAGGPVTWMSRTLRPATVRPVRRRFTDPAKPRVHHLMACACTG